MSAPSIRSIGAPPDRHAERVVDEMLRLLHAERPKLHERADGVVDVDRMGTPKGQRRVVQRLAKAMGPLALEIGLLPAKRGRFTMTVTDWGIWDPSANTEADYSKPPPPVAWLAAVLSIHTGANHRPEVRCMLLVTRHACVRLAQRADVRTVEDLIITMRTLWKATSQLIQQKREDGWLNPPNGVWRLPLAGGSVAVLERDKSGERRLVVKTILDADMDDAVAGGDRAPRRAVEGPR